MRDKTASWFPPEYELADATAIKHLADGTASAGEQQRALKWIIENASGAYEMSYRPTGDRDTCFAEGRRFVGLQIVKMLKLNTTVLKKDKEPSEQQ